MLRLIRQAAFSADTARRSLGDLADPGDHHLDPGSLGYCEVRVEDVSIGDRHHVYSFEKMLWRAQRGRVRRRYWAAERDGLALAQGVGGAARHEQKTPTCRRQHLRTSSGSSQPIGMTTTTGPRFVCKVPRSDADRRAASEELLLLLVRHCMSAMPASYLASALPFRRYMLPLVEKVDKVLLRLRLL
ncbi:hypothetical protein OOU_Y34scaffold00666g172 [Pyricularia oryzae Y34]|uniref:Uncharacterized protein n=4 Tax=Pyricularia oryzae TaxID=318829 RepID=Q2KGH0_PYRO7|nr:hypothetical protein MGCH7_ch7g365 [Pyricularia oryzae 70-15]ELQ36311.1 hypothetical protein OOU_Y34scaffold00666g172 [Pyricularia oryzae Y34]